MYAEDDVIESMTGLRFAAICELSLSQQIDVTNALIGQKFKFSATSVKQDGKICLRSAAKLRPIDSVI